MKMNEIFARRLKELRKDKGTTQQEIADLMKIRRSTYGEYERGKIAPQMQKLQTLAEYFNVSVDYLMGQTDSKIGSHVVQPVHDCAETLKRLIDELHRDGVIFEGKPLSGDSRRALLSALEHAVHVARVLNEQS